MRAINSATHQLRFINVSSLQRLTEINWWSLVVWLSPLPCSRIIIYFFLASISVWIQFKQPWRDCKYPKYSDTVALYVINVLTKQHNLCVMMHACYWLFIKIDGVIVTTPVWRASDTPKTTGCKFLPGCNHRCGFLRAKRGNKVPGTFTLASSLKPESPSIFHTSSDKWSKLWPVCLKLCQRSF